MLLFFGTRIYTAIGRLGHIDQYIEYLLGDMGYLGEEMFIMQCIGQHEVSLSIDNRALHF